MLDDDQAVTGLFQNVHELKDREGLADLQVLEPAVSPAQDRGVVPADVDGLVALQVQVALQGTDEQLSGGI